MGSLPAWSAYGIVQVTIMMKLTMKDMFTFVLYKHGGQL